LHSFSDSGGNDPQAGLIADSTGVLYGTTSGGGAAGHTTVFEITGSGFVPPGVLAGTPGQASCIGKSVSGLANKYGTFLNAAAALATTPSKVLQNAVVIYCGG